MMRTDRDILAAWPTRQAEAFRWLYDRYAGLLLRYCYRFTGNQEHAEEILHDVFTEVLKSDLQDQAPEHLKAWLLTIAKNKSLNFERKKKREVASDSEIAAAVDPKSLEQTLETSQLLERIQTLNETLPKDLAATWALRKQGLDYQDIATELAIPLGTVKSRFSRLVEFFKKELNIEN